MTSFDPKDVKTKKSSSIDQIRCFNPLLNCQCESVDVYSGSELDDVNLDTSQRDVVNLDTPARDVVNLRMSKRDVVNLDTPESTAMTSSNTVDIKFIGPVTDMKVTDGALRNVFIQSAPHRSIGVRNNITGAELYSLSESCEPAGRGDKLDEAFNMDQRHLEPIKEMDTIAIKEMDTISGAESPSGGESMLKRFFQGVSKTLKGREGSNKNST